MNSDTFFAEELGLPFAFFKIHDFILAKKLELVGVHKIHLLAARPSTCGRENVGKRVSYAVYVASKHITP